MASQETEGEKDTLSRQRAMIGYLFTPPEKTADSFSQEERAQTTQTTVGGDNKLPPLQHHTPPASPENTALPSVESATGFATQDRILYAERSNESRLRSQSPLFRRERSSSPSIHSSISSAEIVADIPKTVEPPSDISLTSWSNGRVRHPWNAVGIKSAEDLRIYWMNRMAEIDKMRISLPEPQTSNAPARDSHSAAMVQRLSRNGGVTKPQSVPRTATRAKAPNAASPKSPSPPKKRVSKSKPSTISDFVDTAFPSAQQTKHKRAPASKKVEGDSLEWHEIPDYAPPISTLDSNTKPMTAQWGGNQMSLDDDPDRVHLHPQEIVVASKLRLTCAQYLSNKRKIFRAKLDHLKTKRTFTKTAAQGACTIDVNKASQLWGAFDRAGWFDEAWFQQFM